MKMKFLAITAFALFVTFSACKKTEGVVDTSPKVTILTPTEGQNFATGDTIYFTGTASDNEDLHEGKLEILLASNDSILASKNEYVHAVKSYDFDGRFFIPVASTIDAKARATYEDHDGNITVSEVRIVLKP